MHEAETSQIQLPQVKPENTVYIPPKERITTLKPFSKELLSRIQQIAAETDAKIRARRAEAISGKKGTPVLESTATPTPSVAPEANAPQAAQVEGVSAPAPATSTEAAPVVPVASQTPEAVTPAATPESSEVPPEKKFQLNSDNLAAEVESGTLKRTSTRLVDGVALFGSTHAKANWREESSAPALAKDNIYSYNPRMNDWNPELHPKAEALAMSEMSVLAMRIENKDILDGSLGSMVELGIAILSAELNGQKVVVSLEANIEKTLQEPGALAQYVALESALEDAQRRYPGIVTVQRGGTMDEFNSAIKSAVEQQRNPDTAQKPEVQKIQDYKERRKERLKRPGLLKVFGGSSAPFAQTSREVKTSFRSEQDKIQTVWGGMKALNKGIIAQLWDGDPASGEGVGLLPEGAPVDEKVAELRWAAAAESGLKDKAEVLVWSIQDEAVSKAAITEIGFLLLNALESGQLAMILLEPFNADLYVDTVFREKYLSFAAAVETAKKAAEDAGTPFPPEEIQKADDITNKFISLDRGTVTAKDLKTSKIVTSTQMYRDFDNVRRTRAVIEAQMRKLVDTLSARQEEIGKPFFSFATSVEEYTQQAQRLQIENEWNQGSSLNLPQQSAEQQANQANQADVITGAAAG